MMYNDILKPFFDKFFALVLILGLIPFWLVLFLLIYFTQGSSVFFIQKRTGFKMRSFNLYKIRTLKPPNETGLSLKNRQYTMLGRFLRVSGIDEFPQLFNILKGEMSFVGPRPMPTSYESQYSHNQLRRFNLHPGITGWAQVNGRNEISWEKRFNFDLWYLEHVSFWVDIKIFLMTIIAILQRQKRDVEMPVFIGSELS